MARTTRLQSTSTYSGLAHCCAQRQRTRNLVMKTFKGSDYDRKSLALKSGSDAYRAAMPQLTSLENVQDFIACFTHGLLTDVFLQWEAPVFLSAARTAMSSFQSLQQPEEPASELVHPPKKSEEILAQVA